MRLLVSARASWRHDFDNDGLDSTATFTGGSGAFTTPGQDLPEDALHVGATLVLQATETFTISVQLHGEKASGYTPLAGQVMGAWRFWVGCRA